jgi:histidyl-tRNA synthetase
MKSVQPPRGMRDFLQEEMLKREHIFDTVRTVFELYGFMPIETPALESWELLSKKGASGGDVKDEIYYFKDKGGRELGLRFDLTVPLGRVVSANPAIPKPFKRYHIGRVWRYDRPQAGRYREFWQADADVVGSTSTEADLECMVVASAALTALGFKKFTIRLNDRKILNALVQSVGVKERSVPSVFRTLDKLEKIGEKDVVKELRGHGVGKKTAEKLMRLIRTKGSPKKVLEQQKRKLKAFTSGEEGIAELEEILKNAHVYGISDRVVIDFSLVRGLDYYTGPIFEISVEAGKNVGSVAGGGRYDNLVELYGGKWTPATGISLGIERIYEIMESEKMFKVPSTKTRVFVVSVDRKAEKHAILTAQALRNNGINAQVDVMGRKMSKQLEYVDNAKIPFALFIGEKEFKESLFTLKNMKTGKQGKLSLEDVIKVVKEV